MEEKLNGEKTESETNRERLLTPGIKLRVKEGLGVWGGDNKVMGIKEGMCCDEH